MKNSPDSSGMASSLCGLSSLSSFCGSLLLPSLLAIRTNSRTFHYDEASTFRSLFLVP